MLNRERGEIRNLTVKIVNWHHAVICKNSVTAFLTINDCLRSIRSENRGLLGLDDVSLPILFLNITISAKPSSKDSEIHVTQRNFPSENSFMWSAI